MNPSGLSRSFLVCFFGHLVILAIFSFSWDKPCSFLGYGQVYFLGNFFHPSGVVSERGFFQYPSLLREPARASSFLARRSLPLPLKPEFFSPVIYNKPILPSTFAGEKMSPEVHPLQLALPQSKPSSIIFYPQLPQQLLLFFKDRNQVHIELAFKILPQNKPNIILVKRKISSGNLEADLLSMRYISRYLFIQRFRFPLDSWQLVKIDLSPKSD